MLWHGDQMRAIFRVKTEPQMGHLALGLNINPPSVCMKVWPHLKHLRGWISINIL